MSTRSRFRAAFLFAPTDVKTKNDQQDTSAMDNSTMHKGDTSMMSNRLRIVITAMTLVLLLTPALIWSDKHASRDAINEASIKLPPASTIHPATQSYSPTQLEKDKLLRHTSFSSPARHTQGLPRINAAPTNAAYPGMTPTEIEKLFRVRETTSNTQTTFSQQALDPSSTIDVVPRAWESRD